MDWTPITILISGAFTGTAAWAVWFRNRKDVGSSQDESASKSWGFEEMYDAFDQAETKDSRIEAIKARNFDNVDFTVISTNQGLVRIDILSTGRPVESLGPKYLNALREMEANNELPGRLHENMR